MAKEINRKLTRILGMRFINEKENEAPGFTDELKRYTFRKAINTSQQFQEAFQYNLLTLEKKIKCRQQNKKY